MERRSSVSGVRVSGPSIDCRCSIKLSTPPRLVARVKILVSIRQRHRRRAIAFDFEGNHPAKQLHLSLGEGVLRMRGEPRIMHPRDTRMRIKKLRHPPRVFALRAHPAGQRLHSAMHQPAIERSGHRPADRLDLAQALEKFVILAARSMRRRARRYGRRNILWSNA